MAVQGDKQMTLKLDEYQLEAVKRFSANSTSIALQAVAGSGKSTTLIACTRTRKFLNARNPLVLSFTNSSKKTLLKKNPDLANYCYTTYQIGYRALRGSFDNLTWDVNKSKYSNILYELLNSDDIQAALFNNRLQENLVRSFTFVNEIVKLISLIRVHMVDLEDSSSLLELCCGLAIPQRSFNFAIILARKAIKEGFRLAQGGLIDLTDMIWFPLCYEERVPGSINWHYYDVILSDECQDYSNAQLKVVLAIGDQNTQYFSVGDPMQAIFGFAGSNLRSFDNVSAATCADELTLPVCYRCPDIHLDFVKNLVPHIQGTGKEGVLEFISKSDLLPLLLEKEEGLILARTNYTLLKLAIGFMQRGLEVTFTREKFKNVLKGITNSLRSLDGNYQNFLNMLHGELLEAENARAGYRVDLIRCLILVYEHSNATQWWGYLKYIESLFKVEDSKILLSTIHSAKGDEHNIVYLYDYESLLPGDDTLEEELETNQNVRVVALTRSKKELYLVE